MKRPVVGVTGPDRGGRVAWWMTALAIVRAGGKPVRISPSHPADGRRLDALVLGGGADVDPTHYREVAASLGEAAPPEPNGHGERTGWLAPVLLAARNLMARPFSGLDAARDDLERRLLDESERRHIPILGICRGAQLMNVHYGGTLYQSLKEFYVELPQMRTVLPRKHVVIEPQSRLAAVLGATAILVNALHRQAVRSLGSGLRIVARERTGVVQGIEDPGHPFRIGVQWHPEFIPQVASQRRMFELLVQAVGRQKS